MTEDTGDPDEMDELDERVDDELGNFQLEDGDEGLEMLGAGRPSTARPGRVHTARRGHPSTDPGASMSADGTMLCGLARALVQNQMIGPDQATAIQTKVDAAQGRFIDELVSSGQLRAATLAHFASDTFGLPLLDLAAFDANMLLSELIDTKLLAESRILPIAKRGNRLTVLLSDPTDLQAIDRVKFRAQATVDPIVVEHDKLLKLIEQLSQSLTDQEDKVADEFFSDVQMDELGDGDLRHFDIDAPLRADTST